MEQIFDKVEGLLPAAVRSLVLMPPGGKVAPAPWRIEVEAANTVEDEVASVSSALEAENRQLKLTLASMQAQLNELSRPQQPPKVDGRNARSSAKGKSVRKVDLNKSLDDEDGNDSLGPLPGTRPVEIVPAARPQSLGFSTGVPVGSSSQGGRPTVLQNKPRKVITFQQVKSRVARVSLFNEIRTKAGHWNGY
jgi:hypothetical protein